MTNGTKPLDGSVMLLEREIGQIPFYENQTRKFDMKLQPNLVKQLVLHFRGEANASSAPIEGLWFDQMVGPYSAIRNVQIRASNGVILKSVDGLAMHLLNSMEFASEEMRVQNTPFDTSDWWPFSFDLIIPFENHTGFLPERTVLNTNEFSEIGLHIQWGNQHDFCTNVAEETRLNIRNFVCDIVALERIPLSMEDELLNRQRMVDTMQEKTITVDNERVTFDLPENSLVKTLMFYVERTMQYKPEIPLDPGAPICRIPIENGIARARVEDNNGAHVIKEMSGYQMQSVLRSYYGLEGPAPMPWDAPPNDFYTQKGGVYCLEFDKLHDFTSLYSTIGINYPKLVLDCGALPVGEPFYEQSFRVILLQRQIITPASTTP